MSRVQALAASLVRAHRNREFVALPTDLTTEEAYRVQDLVFAELARGQRPNAWKVGGPGPDVEPTMAQILPGRLFASPPPVETNGFQMIGVEIEVAFRMGEDAKPVEAFVAIEVCDTRLADWKNASPAAKVADFQSNAALVAGSGTSCLEQIDWGHQRAELWIVAMPEIPLLDAVPFRFGIPEAVQLCTLPVRVSPSSFAAEVLK